jgi:hypothetical protein
MGVRLASGKLQRVSPEFSTGMFQLNLASGVFLLNLGSGGPWGKECGVGAAL